MTAGSQFHFAEIVLENLIPDSSIIGSYLGALEHRASERARKEEEAKEVPEEPQVIAEADVANLSAPMALGRIKFNVQAEDFKFAEELPSATMQRKDSE